VTSWNGWLVEDLSDQHHSGGPCSSFGHEPECFSGGVKQRVVDEHHLGLGVMEEYGRHAGVEARVERADHAAGHGDAEIELAERRNVLREYRNLQNNDTHSCHLPVIRTGGGGACRKMPAEATWLVSKKKTRRSDVAGTRFYHIVALDAEPGKGGGEAEAASPGLPPVARRRGGGAVGVDERGALEEADGRERRVVGDAQYGAIHRLRRGPGVRIGGSDRL
jgi:hypothetical protein